MNPFSGMKLKKMIPREVLKYKVVDIPTVLDHLFPPEITNIIGTFLGDEFHEKHFEPIEDWSKKYWYVSDYFGEDSDDDGHLDEYEILYGEKDYFIDLPEPVENVLYDSDDDNEFYDDDWNEDECFFKRNEYN